MVKALPNMCKDPSSSPALQEKEGMNGVGRRRGAEGRGEEGKERERGEGREGRKAGLLGYSPKKGKTAVYGKNG